MSPLEKLKKKMTELNGFNQDTVLTIMVLTRESLEALGLKEQFRHLNFFGNWCVHSELSGSVPCYELLGEITDSLISNPTVDGSSWYTDAISDALDLKKLRSEFRLFFQQHSIPITIFNSYEYWTHFTLYLREILTSKPVSFPANAASLTGRAKALYNHVNAMASAHNGLAAKTLLVTTEHEGPNTNWKSYWNVVIYREGITIQGQLSLNESRSDFSQ